MAKESILDLLTEDRFAAMETVYSERERVIPWGGWRTGLVMYLSVLEAAAIARPTNNAGKDTMEAALVKACFGNQRSFVISLTHGARVGLLFGDDCRLVSRAGQVRYHVTPDGKSRLCHQAGISLSSAEVYDVDFTSPGIFELNLGDESPIIHHPNLPARYAGECQIIAAWAQGVWFEHGVERRAKAIADKARLDVGANHGDPGIWKEHPGKMARNTAVTDLWRYLPRTADMDAASQAVSEEEDAHPVRKTFEKASPMNLPDAGTLGDAHVRDRDGLIIAPDQAEPETKE